MLLNIILYALLGTSFVLGVVELGLSAFVVSAYENTTQEYDTWSGYINVDVKAPAIVDFIVFSSLWTMLVTVAALLLPWFYTRKGSVTPKLNTVLAASFVATYFVTMVFWLAAFADLATYLDYISNDYYNAMIAFAVLLWSVDRVPLRLVEDADISLREQAPFRRPSRLHNPCHVWCHDLQLGWISAREEEQIKRT